MQCVSMDGERARRAPQGARGLKSAAHDADDGGDAGRAPQGACGLKYVRLRRQRLESPGRAPQGACGLKCKSGLLQTDRDVVPRKGHVD